MSHLRSVVLASASALSLFAFHAPACAVPMQAVYVGTVIDSYDQFNLFGQGGDSSLNGTAFVLTFLYDAATPGVGRNTTGEYDESFGGTAYSPDVVNPVQSATLAIGGHSEVINGDHFSYALNFNDGFSAFGNHILQDAFVSAGGSVDNSISAMAYGSAFAVPIDLDTPYVIATALINSSGYFQFLHYDYGTALHTTNTYGYLSLNSLTVSRVEEVPIPAALPLLAAGLGAMGFMGWRRKRSSKVST